MPRGNKSKEDLEKEVKTLRDSVNALQSWKAQNLKHKTDNVELRTVHLRQEQRINELRGEIDTLSKDNDTLRGNLTALNANVDQWEEYSNEKRDELAKLNLYTDEFETRVSDLQECNEDLEDCLVTKKIKSQALKAEHQELKRSNEALWKTIEYLDEVVEEDQIEVLRLRQGILALKEHWESSMQE
ncbi:unnamed protein product [Aureobasidium vineae]|uniref:Uncharacterized protein n=1 Tax=Aureobasidium vineae TaxID=2773715 RepID=A0A9N8JPK7_9PEZI|nr:unnamed protein product [Aureobasidium vineae]